MQPVKYLNLSIIFLCLVFGNYSCKGVTKEQVIDPGNESLIAKITFGSCNKQNENQILWDEIMAEKSNFWIWLGDNIYGDTEDMQELKEQYDVQKNNKAYNLFSNQTSIYGIWDDHDYGTNDGGKDFSKKAESRDLMLQFLDVPKENEVWEREGGYQSYDLAFDSLNIKLILLDSRYFRDHLIKVDNEYEPNLAGTILGDKQWLWFENELSNSKADINLVGNGIQVLAEEHRYEKWNNFPNERRKLLELIARSSASKVILLSGDRHLSELSKITVEEMDYPLYDVTSSGLTHSGTIAKESNKHRIGELISKKSYGVLEISRKEKNDLKIVLKFKGDKKTTFAEFELF